MLFKEETMQLRSMAKINLALDVTGKRPDGYHDVRMIMQTICLYDEIELERKNTPGVHMESNVPFLPVDGRNLAVRAADILLKAFDIQEGVGIKLNKRIPVAAGLAGGSSNAAAVLVGMNRLFSLGLSEDQLMQYGLQLGADVPYCIMRGTALAEGIGEILTPLPEIPPCHILIGKPPVSVSTKYVYEHYDVAENVKHPDVDGMMQAIYNGSLDGIVSRMENVLEQVTVPAYPVIEEIRRLMLSYGAAGARMSGSGPTVFGIFEDRKMAEKAAEALRAGKMANRVYLTRPFQIGRERKS
ncbi:MAG: 4-(cytidine 5'-diphospho)-2-C-methyl-D-erythritol kinase [Eubacterium sp.]|nr:4-(cytidine 5'-diphospho)-2-C-methyl-D-erythritol kinase [Eubacterium sp.]